MRGTEEKRNDGRVGIAAGGTGGRRRVQGGHGETEDEISLLSSDEKMVRISEEESVEK